MVNGRRAIRVGSVTGVNRTLAQASKNRKARAKLRSKNAGVQRRQSAIRRGSRNINNVLDPKGFV